MTAQQTHSLEGVTKYQLHHQDTPALPEQQLIDLMRWYQRCHSLGLLGQDPDRYLGYAYGNISKRWEADQFVISGTQTAAKSALEPKDFCLVTRVDEDNNQVWSEGPVKPSSESMTHAMIYRLIPHATAVIHGHTPEIWLNAAKLGLSITDPLAEYGTPEMSRAVETLLANPEEVSRGVFAMGGHEDGIVAFGASLDEAGEKLLDLAKKAAAI